MQRGSRALAFWRNKTRYALDKMKLACERLMDCIGESFQDTIVEVTMP